MVDITHMYGNRTQNEPANEGKGIMRVMGVYYMRWRDGPANEGKGEMRVMESLYEGEICTRKRGKGGYAGVRMWECCCTEGTGSEMDGDEGRIKVEREEREVGSADMKCG